VVEMMAVLGVNEHGENDVIIDDLYRYLLLIVTIASIVLHFLWPRPNAIVPVQTGHAEPTARRANETKKTQNYQQSMMNAIR
jgi:hypothetical protein